MAPDDLPGLDDESSPDEDGTDAPEPEVSAPDPVSPHAPSTTGAPAPEWTDEELDDWFATEFNGSVQPETYEDAEFLTAMWKYNQIGEGMDDIAGTPYGIFINHTFNPWRILSLEWKAKFRTGWEEYQAARAAASDSGSAMDDMEVLPPIGSLPHDGSFEEPPEDSVIDELVPYPPAGGVPHDDRQDTSSAPGSFRWLVLGISALATPVTTTMSGVAVTTSKSSTTTTAVPVVTTTTSGVAVTTSTSSTTTTAAAPTTGAKSYTVNMPCP